MDHSLGFLHRGVFKPSRARAWLGLLSNEPEHEPSFAKLSPSQALIELGLIEPCQSLAESWHIVIFSYMIQIFT